MGIPSRLEEIRRRIERACRRADRAPDDVRLIAVTKTRSVEEIQTAARAGVEEVGENRVQEAEEKKPYCPSSLRWHLVGHLQKNKARKAVRLFDAIHSLDSLELGRRLDRLAAEEDRSPNVLVQVDLAGESTKFGLPQPELFSSLRALQELSKLRVCGLMVFPPYFADPEEVRPYFRRLRTLAEDARARGFLAGAELSMGMSHDFEVAIEEGATMIRVGTALFGPRPQPAAAHRSAGEG